MIEILPSKIEKFFSKIEILLSKIFIVPRP